MAFMASVLSDGHQSTPWGLWCQPDNWVYSPSSCSSRGVVMGRREDGAAVRDGLEIRLRTHRVGEPGNPAVGRCGAAELEQRTPTPRAMAGLRSRAIGPGARSWLTGAWLVHAPESAARHHEIRRMWSAGRRVPPIARRNGVIARRPARMVSPAIHRGFRRPPRLPALRSPRGSAMERWTRACPGPTKEYGR